MSSKEMFNRRADIYSSASCPCINCEDRTVEPNCHTDCFKYLQFKERRQVIKDEKKKVDLLDNYENEFAAKVHYDRMRKNK